MQKEASDTDRLAAVEAAFENFKAQNAERKTAVKEGRMPEKEYTDWLYQKQGEIDRLMEE